MIIERCARLLAVTVLVPWLTVIQAADNSDALVASDENINYMRCIKAIPELGDIATCQSTKCYQDWTKNYLERRDAGFQCIRHFGRAEIVYYYLDKTPDTQVADVRTTMSGYAMSR